MHRKTTQTRRQPKAERAQKQPITLTDVATWLELRPEMLALWRLVCQWEGETEQEILRHLVVACVNTPLEDMEAFAERIAGRPGETAWARQFWPQCKPLATAVGMQVVASNCAS